MNSLLKVLLFVVGILSYVAWLPAQPPAGSQLPAEENGCALCHGEPRLWSGEQLRLYVPHDSFKEDVHALRGVNCHDCHGGDASTLDLTQAHAPDVGADSTVLPFRSTPAATRQACGICHGDAELLLRKSVHARAERESDSAPGAVLLCSSCHGQAAHGILPVADIRSPVHLNLQVETCGRCHEEDLDSYRQTIHGKGLFESGLVMAAVCADCHGAHGIYYAADERSTLYAANVASTCGECHEGIGARVEKSVHGLSDSDVQADASAEQQSKRAPTCVNCHQGHRLLKTASNDYRLEVANYCGNCHPDLSGRYAMSTHGELTELGYAAAAKCPDCHGAHDILPFDDPQCRLAPGANRLDTCRKCHVNAVQNFSEFDPHADHKNAAKYPRLYSVYSITHGLFLAFLTYFAVHSFLWFVRSFVSVLSRGRHRTLVADQYAIARFTPLNRLVYVSLLVSFLGLTATGLPLKYSTQPWAHTFVQALGGFEYTSIWHRIFGTLGILCCVLHSICVIRSLRHLRRRHVKWRTVLFGPDSPFPTWRDAKDMFGMARWFFGLGPKPRFERWTYWEKYDYWMALLACLLVGTSGLMMWYPNAFCRVISGETLNVARVIHVELAVLVTSFLFVFHFFHTHFRPEKFPMDLSAVTGVVNEDHLRQHRPEYVARLEQANLLEEMRRPAPSRHSLWLTFFAATAVFAIGLGLLAVAITASLGK
jgi:cytochrome b subunit of formate dehydrogenase